MTAALGEANKAAMDDVSVRNPPASTSELYRSDLVRLNYSGKAGDCHESSQSTDIPTLPPRSPLVNGAVMTTRWSLRSTSLGEDHSPGHQSRASDAHRHPPRRIRSRRDHSRRISKKFLAFRSKPAVS